LVDPVAPAAQRALRFLRGASGWAALAIGAYFLCGWIGSSFPAHRQFAGAEDGIDIMIATNGVHTSVVVPVRADGLDWHRVFPVTDLAEPARPYTHIGISWGQREVFLDTPTWADLSPLLVLRVAGFGGEGLMHVEHWVNPQPSEDYRPLRISRAQNRALVRALLRDLPPRGQRRHYAGYGAQDVFYDARGTYTLYRTCNEWTGESLRRAGIRTGAWTPFAGSVMKWVERPL
jgi:uncharacterized protein (TIGR02117 family)